MTSVLVTLVLIAAIVAVFYFNSRKTSKPTAPTSKPKTGGGSPQDPSDTDPRNPVEML